MNVILRKKSNLLKIWDRIWEKEETSFSNLAARLIVILSIYISFEHIFYEASKLSMTQLRKPILAFECIHSLTSQWSSLLLLPFLGLLFIRRRSLFSSLAEFGIPRNVKYLIGIGSLILAWVYSTYNYNYFLDQTHSFDRIGLILFALLSIWRPIFLLPFFFFIFPIISQFLVLPGNSLAAPALPLHILLLFFAHFTVTLMTKKWRQNEFVFLLGCIIASHYIHSGLGKMNMQWILYDKIFLLLPSTYANGWVNFLHADTIAEIFHQFSFFNVPFKIIVLILEFGGLFLFVNSKLPKFIFSGLALMHLGIFMFSGICFWMWALMDVGVVILFFRKKKIQTIRIFQPKHIVLGTAIVLSSGFWSHAPTLSWLDIPLNYTYRFEAISADGQREMLPANYFQPFEYQFTIGTLKYLSKRNLLPVTLGVTSSKKLARWLEKERTETEIFEYEEKNGRDSFNENYAQRFEKFIQSFIAYQNLQKEPPFWSVMKPPPTLWTYPRFVEISESKITQFNVHHITSYFGENGYREIRSELIRKIMN